MARPKLTATELKVRGRAIRKCADLIEQYEMAEGMSRQAIRTRLRLAGFEIAEIKQAISSTPRYSTTDRCIDWMQEEYNGKLVRWRKVVAAGEKAGYSRTTIRRSLSSVAVVRNTSQRNKRDILWKFDWITERRDFEKEE